MNSEQALELIADAVGSFDPKGLREHTEALEVIRKLVDRKCEWVKLGDYHFKTGCGSESEWRYTFCPNCGGKIEMTEATDAQLRHR